MTAGVSGKIFYVSYLCSCCESVSTLSRSWSGRKKRCNILLDLLKKFQSCRGHLSSTMQTAEQAVNEQASYMGKDYLQRSITKVLTRKAHMCARNTTLGP